MRGASKAIRNPSRNSPHPVSPTNPGGGSGVRYIIAAFLWVEDFDGKHA